MSRTREKKKYPESAESGTFWVSTLLDMDSRLRVARGIGKDETQASQEVFETLNDLGHSDGPPPLITDGWGGIDDAILAVYGLVPKYSGKGRPPTRPKAGPDWRYLQMIKHRDEHGRLQSIELKAVWGNLDELVQLMGESTAYVERDNLTSRLFNARLTRKTLAFSKDIRFHRAALIWEDAYYNLVRPHKSLRLRVTDAESKTKWIKRTPAMAAGLTDHIWTVKELLTMVRVPTPNNIV